MKTWFWLADSHSNSQVCWLLQFLSLQHIICMVASCCGNSCVNYFLTVCINWCIIQLSVINHSVFWIFYMNCLVCVHTACGAWHIYPHSGWLHFYTFVALRESFEIVSQEPAHVLFKATTEVTSVLYTDLRCCLSCCCCQSLLQTLLQHHLGWADWCFLSDCPDSDRCWQWIRCWCARGWGTPHAASCSSVGCAGERIRYQAHGALDKTNMQLVICSYAWKMNA